MSVDLYVLSNKQLPDLKAWEAAIAEYGYENFSFGANEPIENLGGGWDVTFGDIETDFEVGPIDVSEVIEVASGVDLGGPWTSALVFYFHGAEQGYAASVAAAAYATSTGGVVYEPQGGTVLTDEDCRKEIAAWQKMLET
jgi:hypothetical protein